MNPFVREKRDGRRAPGYLVYFLAGAAILATFAFVHNRLGQGSPPRPLENRGARIWPITQAASSMSPVRVEKRQPSAQERSFRLPSTGSADTRSPESGTPRPRDAFNAIGAALANAAPVEGGQAPGAAATPLDLEGGNSQSRGSKYAALPPAFPTETARGGTPASGSAGHPELLGYRDPAADVPSGNQGAVEREIAPGLTAHVVPKGTLIRACLLTTVDTSNPSAVIEFAVARDVVFNRHRQLDFGTRLLGRLSGRPMRGRLNLIADTLLYPDGLELPASASAVEADDIGCNIHPGLAARHVPPPEWVTLAPYVSELFTGTMGLLASRAASQVAVGVNGLSVQASVPDGLRGPALQASEQAIQDFTQARLRETEERYAAYDLIPAGTACCLQLDSDLDLSAAHSPGRGATAR
jgi:hypothetical protein